MKSKMSLMFIWASTVLASLFLLTGDGRAQDVDRLLSQPGSHGRAATGRSLPKMSAVLARLVEVSAERGLSAGTEFARQRGIQVSSDRVQVVVQSSSTLVAKMQSRHVQDAIAAIQRLGGTVETSHGNLIQCRIPVAALSELAEQPAVQFVRPPIRPKLLERSEGLNNIGASDWTNITPFHPGGRRTKVCILDLGFLGYQALLGRELPSQVTVRSFRADGDIETNNPEYIHGVACAEIVYDIVPEAEFYLVNFDTDVELSNAVDWIISQDIDVVSCSIGAYNAGDGKGTGPFTEPMSRAGRAGIIWANSAGNEADGHWLGVYSDPDSDGWHEFPDGSDKLEFYTYPGQAEMVFLNWDDWGAWDGSEYPGSTQDYDLYLYYWVGSAWIQVPGYEDLMTSSNVQSGLPGQWPTEEIYGWYSTDPAPRWAVSIRKKSTSRNCQLELFIPTHSSDLAFNTPVSSLICGPDSPYVLGVGATSWIDDSIHYYSSQGPTKDGRVKPDFTAPSGVSTVSYGTLNFYGTSASAPHVAGGFALFLSRTGFSRQEVLQMLIQRAVDLGTLGADNIFGKYGRLNLRK